MKIVFEEREDGEEELVVRYKKGRQISPHLLRLIETLKEKELTAYKQSEIHRVRVEDVYYFEAVGNHTFLYGESDVLEVKQRLYELEDTMGGDFQRISKSVLLNLRKLRWMSPALNGRFEASLANGEKVIVSRQYVAALKKKFGL